MTNLLKASKEILHLHLCEQEGMASGKPTPEMWLKAVDKLAEAIQEVEKESKQPKLSDFVNWHNEKYPDKYIPNCEIGQFNLSDKKEQPKLSAEEFVEKKWLIKIKPAVNYKLLGVNIITLMTEFTELKNK